MNFTELAKTRRSIRAYEKRDITREDLRLCVEPACHAPSACNSQPWKFIIVDDPSVRKDISQTAFSGPYEMNAFASDASAFIIICTEETKFPAWMGGKLRNTDFRKIDLGIACSHIVLQAHELGIGTCILGWFNEKKIKKILSVPASRRIELVISLGYSAQKVIHEKDLKEGKKVLSFNTYG